MNFCIHTDDIGDAVEDKSIERLLVEMMQLCSNVAYHTEMYQIFATHKKK